jgi:hypothetical protein
MTEILVTAAAPDRATALATMAALGIADVSSGEPVPLVEVIIGEVPAYTRSLWNFWYYGSSAEALTLPEPEGGWQPEDGLFERTALLDMVDQRTGIALEWAAFVGQNGEPPGYETPNGVRLYDPGLIASADLKKQ